MSRYGAAKRQHDGVDMQIPESGTCPVCGGENEDRPFCPFCGTRLTEGETLEFLSGDAPPDAPPPSREPLIGEQVPGPVASTVPAPQQPQVEAGPTAPRFAGFWIRVCAYITDSIIIQLIIWMLFSVALFGYTIGASGDFSAQGFHEIYQAQWGSIASLDILIKLIYYTLFLGKTGQTPGKKLFGLRVIRTDGAPVTHSQALIRTIGYYINMLTLEIGFLWVAVDRRKQGLHDKIAGTLEIRDGARS